MGNHVDLGYSLSITNQVMKFQNVRENVTKLSGSNGSKLIQNVFKMHKTYLSHFYD